MSHFSEESLKPSVNRTKGKVPTEIFSEHQKYVISEEKKDISSMTVPFDEQDNFDFTFKRDWETTEKTKNVSARGRLKQNIEFWKNELKPSHFVENIINNVYVMPFTSTPSPFYASNNKSSLRQPQFVSQAITKLQQNNCVEELKQKPYCCNPLTVAEGKKLRLVLDLRHVNKHLKHNKLRHENLSTLSEMLNKGDYFTTFDLTSGYHHIEIHPEHRKFLGFEWTFEDGSTRYFQFCVLPFGLASACYVFTKILRPFTKRWRGRGIKAIIYIDNGIAASRSFAIAKSVREIVRHDLLSAGFVINNEKSDFNPKTKGKWLGTVIDTRELTFTIPQEKIAKLLEDITTYLNQDFLTPKQLSKVAGQLSSMHLAIGPLVRLFTRNMYRFIEKRISWFEQKLVSKNVKEELEFWRDNINIYNGYTFKPRPLTSCLLFTDASDEGYGGFVLKHLNKETC